MNLPDVFRIGDAASGVFTLNGGRDFYRVSDVSDVVEIPGQLSANVRFKDGETITAHRTPVQASMILFG